MMNLIHHLHMLAAQAPTSTNALEQIMSVGDLGLTGVLLFFVWQQRNDNKELQSEMVKLLRFLVTGNKDKEND